MEILSDPTPDMLAMPRFDDGAIEHAGAAQAPRRAGRERGDGRRGRPAVRGRHQSGRAK